MTDGTCPDVRYSDGGYFDHANPYLARLLDPVHQRVLEVGCGAAALGGTWKQSDRRREVWGIELDDQAASLAATRIDRVLRVDLDALEPLPEDAGLFDLITFGDVLEHLRDPHRTLASLAGYLSPHGEILACVPNVGHWTVLAPLLTGRFDYANEGLLDRTHIHLFTPATFREFLVSCGLSVITHEERIKVPGPVTPALAELGVALAGDQTRRADIESDLETYQAVFRARPPAAGPLVGIVVACDATADADVDQLLDEYLLGFRAGEAVLLVLAVAVDDDTDPAAVDRFVARTATALAAHPLPDEEQPDVEVCVYDVARPLHVQLPQEPGRYVTIGSRAGEGMPRAVRSQPTRLEMLRAVRTPA